MNICSLRLIAIFFGIIFYLRRVILCARSCQSSLVSLLFDYSILERSLGGPHSFKWLLVGKIFLIFYTLAANRLSKAMRRPFTRGKLGMEITDLGIAVSLYLLTIHFLIAVTEIQLGFKS